MSLVLERSLKCDGCGEIFGTHKAWPNANVLRLSSKRRSWHTNGTHDWCRKCWKKRKWDGEPIPIGNRGKRIEGKRANS